MNNILLEQVSAKLDKAFKDMDFSIDVDKTYLTSVVLDQGKEVVDYSQSLSWAIMEKVQDDEFPEFNDVFAGVFTEQWTFDSTCRAKVGIEQLNINGRLVVESFRNN